MPLHPDLETSWRQLQIEESAAAGELLKTPLQARYAYRRGALVGFRSAHDLQHSPAAAFPDFAAASSKAVRRFLLRFLRPPIFFL